MNTVLDSDYTTAAAVGQLRVSYPFSAMGDNVTKFYEQDYQQLLVNFSPLTINSVCPWDGAAYLVEETELRKVLGGVVQWTRRYANIPQSRDDASSIAFQFPGLFASYTSDDVTTTITLRYPQTWTVNCRVHMDYYLVGAGGTYANILAIPAIQRQYFYVPVYNGTINTLPGQGADVTFLNPAASSSPTSPTTETYQSWLASGYEFAAEASQLSRWKGNIFQRVTKYVVAR